MKENLKPADKKLLAHIYHNSRESSNSIAKQLHLSREQVAYRIKKFTDAGVIKGHIPVVSYGRLGYRIINLALFKFNKQNHVKEFKEQIKKNKNRITTAELLAKYDLGALFVFKDEKERSDVVSEIISSHSAEISDYMIIEPFFSEFYPLKFLGINKMQPQIFHDYAIKEYKLDEKEKKILKVLNKKANSRIIDIAKQTDLSAELIVYKLKKLKKEKVILTTRAYLDMEKAGYFYSVILISLSNPSKQNQEKVRRFAHENPNVESFMLTTGKPTCYIQIFHQNLSEMHQVLKKLKESFPNDLISAEIIPLKNEGEDVNTLPFL